jgi:hypothetical protein
MFRPHDIQVTGKSVPTDIARAVIAAAAAEVNGPIEKGEILLPALELLASRFSAAACGEKMRIDALAGLDLALYRHHSPRPRGSAASNCDERHSD